MNRSAREMLPFEFIIPVGTDASRLLSILKIDPTAERNLTEVIFTLNGKSRNYRVSTVIVREGRRRLGLAIIMNDVTETREIISHLERLAETDGLTRVDNHRRFNEHAERELAQAKRRNRPITFAIMDIDYFKRVNDQYGHLAGDLVLQRLCDVARLNLRAGDIFCRYGGEEFALILSETQPNVAQQVLERLRGAIEAMVVEFGDDSISVTVSLGLCGAEAACGTDDTQLYISRADRALYIAKSRGRNCVEALPRDAS
jgi:diguanylate cyclase (GGDEF)-like protein